MATPSNESLGRVWPMKMESLEPGDLLEEFWFFCNLLRGKPEAMPRCFSDPESNRVRPEPIPVQGKSYEETYRSIKKLPARRLDMVMVMGEEAGRRKRNRSKPVPLTSRLPRAPSLPASLGREEYCQDEDVQFSMGKLIRQASVSKSSTIAPTSQAAKMLASMPTRNPRLGSLELGGQPLRSLSNMESFKVQAFCKWGLDQVSTEKRRIKDMKMLLKFWARAVASTLECSNYID